MLIPYNDGHYYYKDQRCKHYFAMVDNFYRIIECYTDADDIQYVEENYWIDMNDIEKHVCRQRGWNLDPYFLTDIPTGEEPESFHRKQIHDWEWRFLDTGTYIEFFYIEDEGPYYIGVRFPEYPPLVKEKALEYGVIDISGNLTVQKED